MQQNLNLARSCRPRTFDQVIGQQLAVRMLKNSLYVKKYFPVYLFAGQRGCGKTTTARIFAAAVNCQQLATFQATPTTPLPCLTCTSCKVSELGQHPDFIEIDAASHTGVDNVRTIIEASSYLPLAGQKKIYLIDEAHMLSKAAFNAFLKLLEEPPASVLFMLATTEINKIPTTVLSRCFQVLFSPIEIPTLQEHLASICTSQDIAFEPEALTCIAQETDGSARDAINLLERVRFSGSSVTHELVLQTLGKVSGTCIVGVFQALQASDAKQMLTQLNVLYGQPGFDAAMLWDSLIDLCRTLQHIAYTKVVPHHTLALDAEQLTQLAQHSSASWCTRMLAHLWEREELFLKTSKKQQFLEFCLLELCVGIGTVAAPTTPRMPPTLSGGTSSVPVVNVVTQQSAPKPATASDTQQAPVVQAANQPAWQQFLTSLTTLNAQLLQSIFSQALFIQHDGATKLVTVQLHTNSKFFKDTLISSRDTWFPLLQAAFPDCIDLVMNDPVASSAPVARPAMPAPPRPVVTLPTVPSRPQASAPAPFLAKKTPPPEPVMRIDKEKWPNAHLISQTFPGKLRKLKSTDQE